jgi:hypothetical protein
MLKRQGLKLLRGNATRLDEEDPTPEGKTHMLCKRGTGGDMQQKSRGCDRVVGDPYVRIVDERHGSPRVWSTSGGIPREVAMGVGMVMTGMRLAGVLILVIVLVMHVCGLVVIVKVGWTRMGEEHPMPLAARAVVNDHMQSRHEKGQHQTQAHCAHTRHRLVLWSPTPARAGLPDCAALHPVSVQGITARRLSLDLWMGMHRPLVMPMFRNTMIFLA